MKLISKTTRLLFLFASTATLAMAQDHPADPSRTWQGIPALERTEKGRLYISWFSGGSKEPTPENEILLAHSDDDGCTFTQPVVTAVPSGDGTRCFDPALWIDPKGRLWHLYNRGNKKTATHTIHARICENPDATPPVFGDSFHIPLQTPYAFRLNKPTVLSSGEWILPVTHAKGKTRHWFAGAKQLQGVAISTDEGGTWSLHGALEAPEWALEGMVTELRDGRLWLLIRTGGGVLWESHSTNKGRTWSDSAPSSIPNPGTRFFIRRLDSGNLLLVNHFRKKDRRDLEARVSLDDGKSWQGGLMLDERIDVSYPDGVQDGDGLIRIVYDRDRGGDGDILLAQFREQDVLAGKNVSGAMEWKRTVNRLKKP